MVAMLRFRIGVDRFETRVKMGILNLMGIPTGGAGNITMRVGQDYGSNLYTSVFIKPVSLVGDLARVPDWVRSVSHISVTNQSWRKSISSQQLRCHVSSSLNRIALH